MADVVDGSELKLKGYETTPATVVQSDQRVLVDGPVTGPNNLTAPAFSGSGISGLPQGTVPPSGFPSTTPPSIPLKVNGATQLYPLDQVIANSVSYYLGGKQFEPSVNNQGLPLVPGNTYFNTTNGITYVFHADGTWKSVGSGAPAALKTYYYFPTLPTTILPLGGAGQPDAYGNVLEFDIAAGQPAKNSILVFVNGVLLVGNSDYLLTEGGVGGDYITLFDALCPGACVMVQVFGLPGIVFASAAVIVRTNTWIFNGTQKIFPMFDASSTPIVPGSTANCLLVMGGRVMNPSTEFSVSGSNLTFTIAPMAGESVFLVVGLPIGDGVATTTLTDIGQQLLKSASYDPIVQLQSRVSALEKMVLNLSISQDMNS